MDNILAEIEPPSSARAELKRALLRLAVFFPVLFASHGLMQWLHPMGAHAFFWNLALGAGITWLVMCYLRPIFGRSKVLVFPAERRQG
jgi:heme exporter protein D